MIGRLTGKIIHKQPPQLLIDVHGVGYEVSAPMSTFYQLQNCGVDITLHTHLVVREDAQLLYGFASESERGLFRNLIKINGVGAKLALTILSGMSADEFIHCVRDNNAAALVRMPGIGKKTAERLIIELRDKLLTEPDQSDLPVSADKASVSTLPASHPVSDAVSALISLGYKPLEASRMVRSINTDELVTEEIIRLSLQSINQSRAG